MSLHCFSVLRIWLMPESHNVFLCKENMNDFLNQIPQCGNFRIFLSIRFYVKLVLVTLEPQKLLFYPFEQLFILNFWKMTFSSVKFCKIFLSIRFYVKSTFVSLESFTVKIIFNSKCFNQFRFQQ